MLEEIAGLWVLGSRFQSLVVGGCMCPVGPFHVSFKGQLSFACKMQLLLRPDKTVHLISLPLSPSPVSFHSV